jgi:hypothetical protein
MVDAAVAFPRDDDAPAATNLAPGMSVYPAAKRVALTTASGAGPNAWRTVNDDSCSKRQGIHTQKYLQPVKMNQP